MLKVTNLRKKFNKKNIISNITFEIKEGQSLMIVGQNGSGKSTLLQTIAGYYKHDEGSILLNDKKISHKDISIVAKEERSFFWRLTVKENLMYFLQMYGFDKKNASKKILFYCKLFNIDDKTNELFSSLSSGEKQKINIVRFLARDTKIMLLDEVSLSLDSQTKKILYATLLENLSAGKIIIHVSHDYDDLSKLAKEVILLESDAKHSKLLIENYEDKEKLLNILGAK